jgi:hypothetical protein
MMSHVIVPPSRTLGAILPFPGNFRHLFLKKFFKPSAFFTAASF